MQKPSTRRSSTWLASMLRTVMPMSASEDQSDCTARMTFSGRGIAVVMPRSSVRGKVYIYLDGARVATVDTKASHSQPRAIAWSTRWSAVGTHRISVYVLGTSGRPTISVDGFIVTK